MTELEILPDLDRTPTTLFASPDPAAIVTQAKRIADVIKPIITERHLYKRIGSSDHVYIDAWTLTGSMLGVFATTVRTWEIGDDQGYGACVEARTMAGNVVGRAEAVVTRAEDKWRLKEPFQLVSMAQTRASSKALRMPLGFVMQLAGYDATPAEEMEAAAARGETVSGGRGVAKGWRDKAEQETWHRRMWAFITEHGVEGLVQTIMDSKGYTEPLAKGQMADLRRALDREIEDQKESGAGSRSDASATDHADASPAPGDQSGESNLAGATAPPRAASSSPDHQSDPPPPPPGGGSDPTSPPPTSPGKAVGGGDQTSGVGEREPAAGSAGASAAPMAQGADRDDPTPDPKPLSTDERQGEAIPPDDETVGPAARGEPATAGTASDGTTGAGPSPSPDLSPVAQWCADHDQNIRLCRFMLRKTYPAEFSDLKDWRDLDELGPPRSDVAIGYLDAWFHQATELT